MSRLINNFLFKQLYAKLSNICKAFILFVGLNFLLILNKKIEITYINKIFVQANKMEKRY